MDNGNARQIERDDAVQAPLRGDRATREQQQGAPGGSSAVRLGQLRQQEYPEPAPIVQGLFSAGEVALFIARQKEGKSTLALQIALDIAAGASFLGRFPTIPAPVLYVDYENRPSRLTQRSMKLQQGMGERYQQQGEEHLHFVVFESLAYRDVGLFGGEFVRLREVVDAVKPGVLIIDPLRYALIGGTSKGTADEMLALRAIGQVAQLQRTCPELGTLLVHHTKKGQEGGGLGGYGSSLRADPRSWVDKIYGSQALLAHVDNIWGLEAHLDGEGYTFATVPRSESSLVLRLQKDEEGGRFLMDDAQDASFLATPEQVRAWMSFPDEFGAREIIASLASSKLFYAVVKRAKMAGVLIQDPQTRRYRKVGVENQPN